ncbi:hypothetical protein [Tamaricihabitans halophyticus]|uniref:hypothetical protein n=1 Tax=Tamaricihabitans halophyticus TaxID=1262583 RepID=UPI001046F9B4|nr:hypothetical protein [Tamaricihabitans halophyticus]
MGRRAAVAGTLLLLVGIAAGGYAAWGDGSDPILAEYHVTEPDLDPRRPEPITPPDPLVTPQGKVVQDETGRPPVFLDGGALTEAELRLLVRAGTAQIQTIITRDHGLTRAVWRFTVRDSSSPERVRDLLDEHYDKGGYHPSSTQEGGVLVRHIADPADQRGVSAYRAHYVRGRDVLRVESYGRQGSTVGEAFYQLLRAQTKQFPADR